MSQHLKRSFLGASTLILLAMPAGWATANEPTRAGKTAGQWASELREEDYGRRSKAESNLQRMREDTNLVEAALI